MEARDDKIELVDILRPPLFEPSGQTKPRGRAIDDGDWFGSFNLWIFSAAPVPSILYQQRSLSKSWSPGLLDVVAAGRYKAGEAFGTGLQRETDEEIGKKYLQTQVTLIGRKLFVGIDTWGRINNNVVDIFIVQDDAALDAYTLQAEEVEAIFCLPVLELLKVHQDPGYSFSADGLDHTKGGVTLKVTRDLFPVNYDNYHYKMAVLADRFFKGEPNLLY